MKSVSQHTQSRVMWTMFVVSCTFFALAIIANSLGWIWLDQLGWRVVILGLPAVTVFLHAAITMTWPRALFMFTLAELTGFIFEFIGLNRGVIFGGTYVYSTYHATILGVPLSVMVYWAVFAYCGYSITNSFWLWLRCPRPTHLIARWWQILPLVLSDTILVVLIDIFMDPLMVQQGVWTWHGGGAYFGVPIGNFIGWGVVAAIISLCIRSLDYARPIRLPAVSTGINLIPILGYFCIASSLALLSLSLGEYLVMLIGFSLMMGVIVSNVFLFRRYRQTAG